MKLGNVNTAMIKDRYVKNAFDSHPLGFRSILFTSASGVILDFSGFLLGFVLLALLQRNPCFSHIVPRIHLSLFNFVRRLSAAAPRVTCHPDLIVYH